MLYCKYLKDNKCTIALVDCPHASGICSFFEGA